MKQVLYCINNDNGPHYSKGLCRTCYNHENHKTRKPRTPKVVKPTLTPQKPQQHCLNDDRPVHAKGLCNRCYSALMRKLHPRASKAIGTRKPRAVKPTRIIRACKICGDDIRDRMTIIEGVTISGRNKEHFYHTECFDTVQIEMMGVDETVG